MDPTKSLSQHYGAIQGLAAFGPTVVSLLILPNLELYLQLLEPEMLLEKQKNEMKRHEAWRVYGALQCAAGLCVYDRLKKFRRLLSPPTHFCWKSNGKLRIMPPNKRKASMDNLMQQPPLKKMATNGTMGVLPMNSMHVNMQRPTGGYPTVMGGSSIGVPAMRRQLPNEKMLARKSIGQALKTSTLLAQAWKPDMEGGLLLASLFELLGESMFCFTPKPELSFFL